MLYTDPYEVPDKWIKTILRSYWFIAILYWIGTSASFFFTDENKREFLIRIIVIPGASLLTLAAVSEWLWRRRKDWSPYIFIFSSNLIAIVIIVSNYEIEESVSCLLLPLFIAVYFLRKKYLVLASLTGISLLMASIVLFPSLRETLSPPELITLAAVYLISAIVLFGLMKRAAEFAVLSVQAVIDKRIVEEEKQLIERLLRIDGLTELYNHRTFYEELESRIAKLPESNRLLQLAVIDIDNFKSINDTYGHQTGDEVIKGVARTICRLIGPEDIAFRYGGEEFAIIFARSSLEECVQAAEELRIAVSRLAFLPDNEELNVTVSIGVQAYAEGMTKFSLFDSCDQALYEAKRTGKNKTVVKSIAG